MRRILFLTDTLMAGGLERHVMQLATSLNRLEFDPYVICLYGPRAGRSLYFSHQIEHAGIPLQVLDLGWGAVDKLTGIHRIACAVWRFKPHLVHAFNYHSNLLGRLARPFMPSGTQLIGDVQTKYTDKQLSYEHLSGWLCSAMTCNSPAIVGDLIQRARIQAGKIVEIPNGVDLTRFSHTPDEHAVASIRQGTERVLLMVGRISVQKSPQLLAEAIGTLKVRGQLPSGVRFIIVGECEDRSIQEKLDRAIQTYALDPIIELHGPVTQPELFYNAADATVLFSLWEGLPYAVVESLAAGRPAVVSEAANAASIIEDGVTGWVARTGDIEHLADRLAEVLSLPQERLESMRAACYRRAQDFSIEKMVARYEHLYFQLSSG